MLELKYKEYCQPRTHHGRKGMFIKIVLIFCTAVSWLVLAGGADAASVELFSTEHTVRDIRWVTVRFTD